MIIFLTKNAIGSLVLNFKPASFLSARDVLTGFPTRALGNDDGGRSGMRTDFVVSGTLASSFMGQKSRYPRVKKIVVQDQKTRHPGGVLEAGILFFSDVSTGFPTRALGNDDGGRSGMTLAGAQEVSIFFTLNLHLTGPNLISY